MDGSAKKFVELILQAGIQASEVPIKIIKVEQQVEVREGDKIISINKSNVSLDIDFEIKYQNPFIKTQRNKVNVFEDNLTDIYNSRTFCLFEDIEKLQDMELGKGGSLENALVVKGNSLINKEGLRNEKEFVNHKILDCMGDLYLSGYKMIGSLACSQGGHYLTNKLLRKLFSDQKNYSLIEIKGKNLPHSLANKNQLRSIA
jgi:UDP-3-O-[3-hydroxymyristoyl] N-acetylglucosamine deacetylase